MPWQDRIRKLRLPTWRAPFTFGIYHTGRLARSVPVVVGIPLRGIAQRRLRRTAQMHRVFCRRGGIPRRVRGGRLILRGWHAGVTAYSINHADLIGSGLHLSQYFSIILNGYGPLGVKCVDNPEDL